MSAPNALADALRRGRCSVCRLWHSGDAPAGCWKNEWSRVRAFIDSYHYRDWSLRYRRQVYRALRQGWRAARVFGSQRPHSPYQGTNHMAPLANAWAHGWNLGQIRAVRAGQLNALPDAGERLI